MTISTSRKLNMISLTVMFALGTLVAFSPFAIAWWKMHSFCRDLPIGTSYEDIERKAKDVGYVVSPIVDGRARIDDPPSYGRRSCSISFGERGLAKVD